MRLCGLLGSERDTLTTIEKQKQEYSVKQKMFLVKFLHFVVSVLLFYVAFLIFRYDGFPQELDSEFRYNYLVTVAYACLLIFFNNTMNSYLFGYDRIRGLAFSQFLAQVFSLLLMLVSVCLAWNSIKNPSIFLGLLLFYVVWDCTISYCGNGLYTKLNPPKRTLLIYRNNRDRRRFGSLAGKPTERLYKIEKEIKFDGGFDEIRPQLSGFDAIFVAGLNSHCRNGILKYCEEHSIRGFFLPHIGDVIMQGAEHIQTFDSPVLQVRRKSLSPEYRVIKRALDMVISACGLIILSPIMLVTAIAIKAYDKGPVFYKQTRLTRNEKEFEIIKFRSMKVDAEKDGVARLSKGENDDRITPVGRVIRACRLDELPQLWNILIGDMSIVGPRPERPEIAEQYYKSMPEFKLRLQVKAGLTGYAQVYGKYNTDPYEKLEFDLLYINHMSIITDLQLMFSTFSVLFDADSTKGVDGITAINYEND